MLNAHGGLELKIMILIIQKIQATFGHIRTYYYLMIIPLPQVKTGSEYNLQMTQRNPSKICFQVFFADTVKCFLIS